MKRPHFKDEPVLQELIESARHCGDSKSIFGLLLLLEREICSETQHSRSGVATPQGKKVANRRGTTVFKRYIE